MFANIIYILYTLNQYVLFSDQLDTFQVIMSKKKNCLDFKNMSKYTNFNTLSTKNNTTL